MRIRIKQAIKRCFSFIMGFNPLQIKRAKYGARRSVAGFTLIELMVVIVILGILAGFIMPKILSRPEEARRIKAKVQIKNFEAALSLYKLDTGDYPPTEYGLGALATRPSGVKNWNDDGYLEKDRVPKDPWGNKYIYISPGVHNKDYDIISYGKDGMSGGDGSDRDITSWDEGE